MMITAEELDIKLLNAGMLRICDRLEHSPLDFFFANTHVTSIETLYEWVTNTRRENMEMLARHELSLHVLPEEILDFVLGKSAILTEMHVNLRNIMSNQND